MVDASAAVEAVQFVIDGVEDVHVAITELQALQSALEVRFFFGFFFFFLFAHLFFSFCSAR